MPQAVAQQSCPGLAPASCNVRLHHILDLPRALADQVHAAGQSMAVIDDAIAACSTGIFTQRLRPSVADRIIEFWARRCPCTKVDLCLANETGGISLECATRFVLPASHSLAPQMVCDLRDGGGQGETCVPAAQVRPAGPPTPQCSMTMLALGTPTTHCLRGSHARRSAAIRSLVLPSISLTAARSATVATVSKAPIGGKREE